MARPFKFNTTTAATVLAYVRTGSYLYEAAAAAGISEFTLQKWLNRPEKVFRDFAEAVRQAAAQAEVIAAGRTFREDPKFWLTHGPSRDRWRPADTKVKLDAQAKVELDLGLDAENTLSLLELATAEIKRRRDSL